jgi:hypothetical protein
MACCAFVAFLLGQIYLVFRTLIRWTRGMHEAPQRTPAAMWRLSQPVTRNPQPSPLAPPASLESFAPLAPLAVVDRSKIPPSKVRVFGLVSLALVAELAIMIGGTQAFMGAGVQALMNDAEQLLNAKSLAELKIICTARR